MVKIDSKDVEGDKAEGRRERRNLGDRDVGDTIASERRARYD